MKEFKVKELTKIDENKANLDWNNWKWQLQNRIRTIEELEKYIQLEKNEQESFENIREYFQFAVTPYYLSLSDFGNSNCPIRKQFVPNQNELIIQNYEIEDPLAEEKFMPVKGVTHRYPDRALWYLSHSCAVYCRFCTRKRKVSQSNTAPNSIEQKDALEYFKNHQEIKEVILSGGDPLNLSDEKLDEILGELRSISHINQVRLHTRYPVTLPMRLTQNLAKIFRKYFPLYVVTHFNHQNELSPESISWIKSFILESCSIFLNQSVLLKGINNSSKDLIELFYKLTSVGIKPYYLHHCDEVLGSSSFRVSIEEGMRLMKEIRGRISGVAVPSYVIDLKGGGGKVPLPTDYLSEKKENSWVFRNYNNENFEIYPFE